jgi:hypothetical protein
VATQTKPRDARTASRSAGDGDGAVIAAADLQPLLEALQAAARGEQAPRLDARKRGLVGRLNKAFNATSDVRERTLGEIDRVAAVIGREGRLTERAAVKGRMAPGARRSGPSTR